MIFESCAGKNLHQHRERAQATTRPSVDAHVELLDGRSAALVGSDHLHLHDLDGVGASAMAGAHVTIWQQRKTTVGGREQPFTQPGLATHSTA